MADTGSRVVVYQDREELSLAAAGLFAVEARTAADSRGVFRVLLCGGETPRRLYQLLGREPLSRNIPWSALQLYWGDERYVPHDHPLSNFGMVRQTLLKQVPLEEGQIHPIPYGPSPKESAAAYARLLRAEFGGKGPRFDLTLLGLGEDGHTASLFPGSSALEERERWVTEVDLPDRKGVRITVTLPVLNGSALIAFLVSGAEKGEILKEVLQGEIQGGPLPAQLVRPEKGKVLWLVDRQAAAQLSARGEPSPLGGTQGGEGGA